MSSDPSSRIEGPEDSPLTLLFAHGAGAPMDSLFMETVAHRLAAKGWRVRRFEFPYMAQRRTGGKKSPPDRLPVLLEAFRDRIAEESDRRLVLAGKSMGGRVASLLADEAEAAGWLCFGYPFHPPGRPKKLRTDHLRRLKTPSLIIQGARDPFGTRAEVAAYDLSPSIGIHWIEDGNHDLAPRKRSGTTADDALQEAVAAADGFLRGLTG